MVTILLQDGMRFVIYLNDHEPAHIHVYADGEARIDIVELRVLSVRGMTKRDVARALTLVAEHQADFLSRWMDIHG